jgi:hypothetical protein
MSAWLMASAVLMTPLGPRRIAPPPPLPFQERPMEAPIKDLNRERLDIDPSRVVLDGWAFYARAGGMIVATGESTRPWIYGCEHNWNYDIPFCRIGRATFKMPNQLFLLFGMAFITAQDAVRQARANSPVSARPKYKVSDVIDGKQINLRALLAVLPLINFSLLENGAYGNLLFTL